MVSSYCALVVGLAVVSLGSATLNGEDCKEFELIPFAGDDIVCGFKMMQAPTYTVLTDSAIDSHPDLGPSWTDLSFDDSTWEEVSMPLGYQVDQCSALYSAYPAPPSLWHPNNAAFIRRKFYIDEGLYRRLQSVKIEYLVDDAMEGIYVNGVKQGSYPMRQTCSDAVDSVSVSKAQIEIGDNVLAVHGMDRGDQTFMNIRVTIQVCPESAGSIEFCSRVFPQACRRPCLDQDDMCQNYDCGTTESYAADVTGECLCEMKMGLHCSGAIEDTDVCYPSMHTVALSSAKILCPSPKTECPTPEPPQITPAPGPVCESRRTDLQKYHRGEKIVGDDIWRMVAYRGYFRSWSECKVNSIMAFDTVKSITGGDPDLGSPNENCGSKGQGYYNGPGEGNGGKPNTPGENCIPLGMVAIANEQSTTNYKARNYWNKCKTHCAGSKTTVTNSCWNNCQPDDNADGATFVIKFSQEAQLKNLNMLDIDEPEGSVKWKLSGTSSWKKERGHGNNSYNKYPINLKIPQNGKLIVTCKSSCALIDVEYDVCT